MEQQLEKMKNNQDKSSWGGIREGSGRKPGVSKATELKRKFQDYVSEETVEGLVKQALAQANEKPELLKFVLEQLFGKAPQAVDFQGQGHFVLEIAKQIADKHEEYVPSQDTGDSSGGQT